jgi:hypothetical protein
MNEWELREYELLKKENAWYDKLNPFWKMIDSHSGYILFLLVMSGFSIGIGILIGLSL